MRTWPNRIGAVATVFVALALAASAGAHVGQAEEDFPACDEAIEAAAEEGNPSPDWGAVANECASVMDEIDESHRNYEYYKEYLAFALQATCEAATNASDWDGVIATCEQVLEAFPQAFQFNLSLGLAYYSMQDWPNATKNFAAFLDAADASGQAAQLQQQIALAGRQAAFAFLQAEDTTSAIPMLERAAMANPADVDVQWELGRLQLQADNDAGAEMALSAVIEHDPDRALAWFLAGQINFQDENYELAAERLQGYLAAEPEGDEAGFIANAHWMLASIYVNQDEQRQAETHFQAFLEAVGNDEAERPRAAQARYQLGTFAFNRNQCDTALRHYNEFLRLAPRNDQNRGAVNELILDIEDGICEPGLV